MYDPFANQPLPGTPTTPLPPQTNPAQPNPTPVPPAVNNALAQIMAKHMGQMDPNSFQYAKANWRAARPDRPTFSPADWQGMHPGAGLMSGNTAGLPPEVAAYITAMNDWRGARPRHGTWVPPTPAVP